MRVFYKNPVDNEICNGSYDKLKDNENLKYFNVRFFKTSSEAKKEVNI